MLNSTFPFIVKLDMEKGRVISVLGLEVKLCFALLVEVLDVSQYVTPCTPLWQRWGPIQASHRWPVTDMIWRLSSPALESRPTAVLHKLKGL